MVANNFRLKFAFISICLVAYTQSQDNVQRPHIIFIIADDLGFNDVGFHGTNDIPTPNIDALAYSGVILNNYYVNAICTPSRSALMTGKYPIHTGMQHTVLFGAEPRGLPLSEKLLPQYLEELGYVNHIVGKWHLGSWKKEYTPLYRGFVSHTGFWTGHQDYNDHTAMENNQWGLDMRQNMSVAYELHGQYSTDVFTNVAKNIINAHDKSKPLFLYLAHAAVHSGNPYNPLPAPDSEVGKFRYIENYSRQRFGAVLSKMDDSVGQVVDALKSNNMLENSIIVFTSDNGGPAEGFNINAASNYPLRGVKNTLWEGGVRGAALIWSPLIEKSFRISNQLMQIADWLPTLLKATGGDLSVLPDDIDGINIWDALSNDTTSPRTEILHNIDDIYGNSAVMVGQWKVVKGTTYDGTWDSWYGPSGRNYLYNSTKISQSLSGQALYSVDRLASPEQIETLRNAAQVNCSLDSSEEIECKPLVAPCLFNVVDDPCEKRNLAAEYPSILSDLLDAINRYNATVVPPGNLPIDPKGDPKYWNYVFTNFGDFEDDVTVSSSSTMLRI